MCIRDSSRDGATFDAPVLVSAIGMFHSPKVPDIPGLDEFTGPVVHSARWDPGLDLRDQRVSVIGTGASAIQIVPAIAGEVAHVDVYQRTPPWVLPRENPPFTDEQKQEFAERPEVAAKLRQDLHDMHEGTTVFLTGDRLARKIEAYARSFLEESVPDPVLREQLTPR